MGMCKVLNPPDRMTSAEAHSESRSGEALVGTSDENKHVSSEIQVVVFFFSTHLKRSERSNKKCLSYVVIGAAVSRLCNKYDPREDCRHVPF